MKNQQQDSTSNSSKKPATGKGDDKNQSKAQQGQSGKQQGQQGSGQGSGKSKTEGKK